MGWEGPDKIIWRNIIRQVIPFDGLSIMIVLTITLNNILAILTMIRVGLASIWGM